MAVDKKGKEKWMKQIDKVWEYNVSKNGLGMFIEGRSKLVAGLAGQLGPIGELSGETAKRLAARRLDALEAKAKVQEDTKKITGKKGEEGATGS